MKLINFLPLIFVFIASFYNSADLDLGWHLKYGQQFVNPPAGEPRIAKANTFSSEMEGYRYPNTSWASDVILYVIYSKLGFLGITILGAMVITLTFYFFTKAAKLTLFGQSLIFPALIFLLAPQNAASYRAQLLSFLFMGILFYLLLKFTVRRLLPIPFLFLIWANLHGEYLTGLVLFGVFVAIKVVRTLWTDRKLTTRSDLVVLITILIASILATLINPYGINIYLESLRHFGNPLQKYVIEWLPFEIFSLLWWKLIIVGFASALGLSVVSRKLKSDPNLPIYLIIFLLFALSLWSRRYSWHFFYFSIFLIDPLIAHLEPKDKKAAKIATYIFLALFASFALFSKRNLGEFTNMNWEKYCLNYVQCSPKSAQYLVDNDLTQNLYTFYDWGGFLMFNYPIKPSMDGRMALWRDENGFSSFETYYALQQNWQDIDKSSFDVVLINHRKPIYFHLLELEKTGQWTLRYEDPIASVFTRN